MTTLSLLVTGLGGVYAVGFVLARVLARNVQGLIQRRARGTFELGAGLSGSWEDLRLQSLSISVLWSYFLSLGTWAPVTVCLQGVRLSLHVFRAPPTAPPAAAKEAFDLDEDGDAGQATESNGGRQASGEEAGDAGLAAAVDPEELFRLLESTAQNAVPIISQLLPWIDLLRPLFSLLGLVELRVEELLLEVSSEAGDRCRFCLGGLRLAVHGSGEGLELQIRAYSSASSSWTDVNASMAPSAARWPSVRVRRCTHVVVSDAAVLAFDRGINLEVGVHLPWPGRRPASRMRRRSRQNEAARPVCIPSNIDVALGGFSMEVLPDVLPRLQALATAAELKRRRSFSTPEGFRLSPTIGYSGKRSPANHTEASFGSPTAVSPVDGPQADVEPFAWNPVSPIWRGAGSASSSSAGRSMLASPAVSPSHRGQQRPGEAEALRRRRRARILRIASWTRVRVRLGHTRVAATVGLDRGYYCPRPDLLPRPDADFVTLCAEINSADLELQLVKLERITQSSAELYKLKASAAVEKVAASVRPTQALSTASALAPESMLKERPTADFAAALRQTRSVRPAEASRSEPLVHVPTLEVSLSVALDAASAGNIHPQSCNAVQELLRLDSDVHAPSGVTVKVVVEAPRVDLRPADVCGVCVAVRRVRDANLGALGPAASASATTPPRSEGTLTLAVEVTNAIVCLRAPPRVVSTDASKESRMVWGYTSAANLSLKVDSVSLQRKSCSRENGCATDDITIDATSLVCDALWQVQEGDAAPRPSHAARIFGTRQIHGEVHAPRPPAASSPRRRATHGGKPLESPVTPLLESRRDSETENAETLPKTAPLDVSLQVDTLDAVWCPPAFGLGVHTLSALAASSAVSSLLLDTTSAEDPWTTSADLILSQIHWIQTLVRPECGAGVKSARAKSEPLDAVRVAQIVSGALGWRTAEAAPDCDMSLRLGVKKLYARFPCPLDAALVDYDDLQQLDEWMVAREERCAAAAVSDHTAPSDYKDGVDVVQARSVDLHVQPLAWPPMPRDPARLRRRPPKRVWTRFTDLVFSEALHCERHMAETLEPLLRVDHFVVCDEPKTLDICADVVRLSWHPDAALRVFKTSREVTLWSWSMLLALRKVLAPRDALDALMGAKGLGWEGKTPALDSLGAFQERLLAAATFRSYETDQAIRLGVEEIDARATFGRAGAVAVSAALYSQDLPSHFEVRRAACDLGETTVLRLQRLDVRECVDAASCALLGKHLADLRNRLRVLAKAEDLSACTSFIHATSPALPPGLMQRLTTRRGIGLGLQGAELLIPNALDFAGFAEALQRDAASLTETLGKNPGPWVPRDALFPRYFWCCAVSPSSDGVRRPHEVAAAWTLLDAPVVWLRLLNFRFGLEDETLESFLQLAQPLWREEMSRRVLKGAFHRRVQAALEQLGSVVAGTPIAMGNDGKLLRGLRSLRNERAQRRRDPTGAEELGSLGSGEMLFSLHVGEARLECPPPSFLPPSLDSATARLMQPSTPTGDTPGAWDGRALDIGAVDYSIVARVAVTGTIRRLSGRLRQFADPLFACGKCSVQRGDFCVAAPRGENPAGGPLESFPRVYFNLQLDAGEVEVTYSPELEYTAEEMAWRTVFMVPPGLTSVPLLGSPADADAAAPSSQLPAGEALPNLTWWDALRRLLHGRFEMTVEHAAICLAASAGLEGDVSRDHALLTPNPSIVLHVRAARLAYDHPALEMLAAGVTVHRSLALAGSCRALLAVAKAGGRPSFEPLALLPGLRLNMGMEWDCLGEPLEHHDVPVRLRDGAVWVPWLSGGRCIEASAWAEARVRQEVFDAARGDPLRKFRSRGVHLGFDAEVLTEAPTELSGFVDADNAEDSPLPEEVRVHVDVADLGWMFAWTAAFKQIPKYPYPKRKRSEFSGMSALKAHLHMVRFQRLRLGATRVAIVAQPPPDLASRQAATNATNAVKTPSRSRAVSAASTVSAPGPSRSSTASVTTAEESESGAAMALEDRVVALVLTFESSTLSLLLKEEDAPPNPFTSGRIRIPDTGTRCWTLSRVVVAVDGVEVGLAHKLKADGDNGDHRMDLHGDFAIQSPLHERSRSSMTAAMQLEDLANELEDHPFGLEPAESILLLPLVEFRTRHSQSVALDPAQAAQASPAAMADASPTSPTSLPVPAGLGRARSLAEERIVSLQDFFRRERAQRRKSDEFRFPPPSVLEEDPPSPPALGPGLHDSSYESHASLDRETFLHHAVVHDPKVLLTPMARDILGHMGVRSLLAARRQIPDLSRPPPDLLRASKELEGDAPFSGPSTPSATVAPHLSTASAGRSMSRSRGTDLSTLLLETDGPGGSGRPPRLYETMHLPGRGTGGESPRLRTDSDASSGLGLALGFEGDNCVRDELFENLFRIECRRPQLQLMSPGTKGCVIICMDDVDIDGRVSISAADAAVALGSGADDGATSTGAASAAAAAIAAGTAAGTTARSAASTAVTTASDVFAFESLQELEAEAPARFRHLLQLLVQRGLGVYLEQVTLNLRALRVLCAPTDVDISAGVLWIPSAAFSQGGSGLPSFRSPARRGGSGGIAAVQAAADADGRDSGDLYALLDLEDLNDPSLGVLTPPDRRRQSYQGTGGLVLEDQRIFMHRQEAFLLPGASPRDEAGGVRRNSAAKGLRVLQVVVPATPVTVALLVRHGAIPDQNVRIHLPLTMAAMDPHQFSILSRVAEDLAPPPQLSAALAATLDPSLGFGLAGDAADPSGMSSTSIDEDDADLETDFELFYGNLSPEDPQRDSDPLLPLPSLGDKWRRLESLRWRLREVAWLLRQCRLSNDSAARLARAGAGFTIDNVLQELVDAEGSGVVSAQELLSRWDFDLCASFVRWQRREVRGSGAVRDAVQAVTMAAQVHPTVHLSWDLGECQVFLFQSFDEAPMLRLEITGVCGGFMAFENQAGSLELDVGNLTVTHQGQPKAKKKREGSLRGEETPERDSGAPKTTLLLSPLTEELLSLVPPANITGRVLPHLPGSPMVRFDGALDPNPHLAPGFYGAAGAQKVAFVLRHTEINVAPLAVKLHRAAVADVADFFTTGLRSRREKSPSQVTHERRLRSAFLDAGANAGGKAGTSREASTKADAASTARSKNATEGRPSDLLGGPAPVPGTSTSLTRRVRGLFRKASHGPGGNASDPAFGAQSDPAPFVTVGIKTPDLKPLAIRRALPANDLGRALALLVAANRVSPDAESAARRDEQKRRRWRQRLHVWRNQRREESSVSLLSLGPVTIKRLRFGEVNVFLSYKGDTKGELETIESLQLKVHPLVYAKRTCTINKLLVQMRNDLILDLLGQVHRNFNNIGTLISQRLGFQSHFSQGGSSMEYRESESLEDNGTEPTEEDSPSERSTGEGPSRLRLESRSFAPEQGTTLTEEPPGTRLSPTSVDKRALLLGGRPSAPKKRFWNRK